MAHLLLGEALTGIYFVQWLLACATTLMMWKIATRLFGRPSGRIALVLSAILFVWRLLPAAGTVRPDSLYLPALTAAALAVIAIASRGRATAATQVMWLAFAVVVAAGFSVVMRDFGMVTPPVMAIAAVAAIGLAVLLFGRITEGLRGPIRGVPLAMTLSHFAMLLPYAAVGILWAVDFLVPPEEE
jgi:hypothetical protein